MIIKYPNGTLRLQILDRFEVDVSLPKYKRKENSNAGYVASTQVNGFGISQSSNFIVSSTSSSVSNDMVSFSTFNSGQTSEKESLFSFIKRNISKLFSSAKSKIQEVPIQKVFETIIANQKELEHIKLETEKYIGVMDNAKRMGQVALYEKLKRELPIKLTEEKLTFNGFTKFISEQDVIKFSKNSARGLKLVYIKNFIRSIPSEVQLLKTKADEIEAFDNYAILFYDPENKATAMTEKEIEKAKDPILFGVIENSDKLYFVGDWKDELCDLTFDEMIKKLAEQPKPEVKPEPDKEQKVSEK